MSAMSEDKDIVGSYILWIDHGYEGWQPISFNSIEEAIKAAKYSEWIITKRTDFRVTEC